jgi:hypothetical protein
MDKRSTRGAPGEWRKQWLSGRPLCRTSMSAAWRGVPTYLGAYNATTGVGGDCGANDVAECRAKSGTASQKEGRLFPLSIRGQKRGQQRYPVGG